METRRRIYWKHRIRYRYYSFRRRHRSGYRQTMFQILELGGRTISELRDPTVELLQQPKRVRPEMVCELHKLLQPGDIIISRHRDALTNRFLPGFWPHASLFVGTSECGDMKGEVVEARKDGVRLRKLEDTLAVDAFVVLRASENPDEAKLASQKALTHVGKLYDFSFDFRQSDRLACTAVIYRSWHGLGNVRFQLRQESGRMCLSAENLIAQAMSNNAFKVVSYLGPDAPNLLHQDEAARQFAEDWTRLSTPSQPN